MPTSCDRASATIVTAIGSVAPHDMLEITVWEPLGQGWALRLMASPGTTVAGATATAADGGLSSRGTTFVAARTVQTAPLEWCAVLLGRGTHVCLKVANDRPGLGPWLTHHARRITGSTRVTRPAPRTCSPSAGST